MAKDYTVEVTLVMPFTASGPTQAEERAATLEDAIGEAISRLKLRWLGDVDFQWSEIEGEET